MASTSARTCAMASAMRSSSAVVRGAGLPGAPLLHFFEHFRSAQSISVPSPSTPASSEPNKKADIANATGTSPAATTARG
eukprot:5650445-Prymnesium_polylepis.1